MLKGTETATNGRRGSARPPNAGIGREKGVPNKITRDIRAMIEGALDEAGGKAYLVQQAKENPVAFMGLVARILPRDISITATVNHADMILDAAKRRGITIEHQGGAQQSIEVIDAEPATGDVSTPK